MHCIVPEIHFASYVSKIIKGFGCHKFSYISQSFGGEAQKSRADLRLACQSRILVGAHRCGCGLATLTPFPLLPSLPFLSSMFANIWQNNGWLVRCSGSKVRIIFSLL